MLDGHGFTSLDASHPDHVDVEVEGVGTVRTRYVVAADGMWSPVRKAVGATVPGYRGEWHAFRQYARNVTGPAAERLIVWFEPDLLPGYAWSFPLPGNRVNIGFGVLRDGERKVRDMAELWRDLLARPHVVEALGTRVRARGPAHGLADPGPHRRHRAHPRPRAVRRRRRRRHRRDDRRGHRPGAAHRPARRRGDRRRRCARTRCRSHRSTSTRSRDELFADHRMSKRLGTVLASERGARGAIRVVAASGDWGRRNFARWMFEDEPRAILTTPRRWHRQLLQRPGAYA